MSQKSNAESVWRGKWGCAVSNVADRSNEVRLDMLSRLGNVKIGGSVELGRGSQTEVGQRERWPAARWNCT